MSKSAITRTGGRDATEGLIEGDVALAVGMPTSSAPNGWKWTKLTDVSRLETGHTPSRQKPEYWDGDIPWIGIRDATANHGRTLLDTVQHVTQEGIDNSSARILPANTVCLSRTASVGYVVVMGREMATSQDFVNWVCDESKLDHRFLKYVLLAENRSFSRFSHGTTHQTIYFPEVKAFHVCVPSVSEQRDIADVLTSLDNKIEQNRRTGQALEELARATFKAWFVDFEPVKAKAAGATSFPGMQDAAFAAFPDRLTDSPFGPVPQGWTVRRLDDVLTLHYGKSLTKTKRQPGHVPVYGSGGIDGTHNEALVEGPGIVVGRKGSVGTIYWADTDFFPIDTTYYVEPKGHLRLPYLYELLKTIGLESMNTDAAVPGLNRENAYRLEVVVPSPAVVQGFDEFVDPVRKMLRHLGVETSTLAALRNYLLPRLMSGAVRVRSSQAEAEG